MSKKQQRIVQILGWGMVLLAVVFLFPWSTYIKGGDQINATRPVFIVQEKDNKTIRWDYTGLMAGGVMVLTLAGVLLVSMSK